MRRQEGKSQAERIIGGRRLFRLAVVLLTSVGPVALPGQAPYDLLGKTIVGRGIASYDFYGGKLTSDPEDFEIVWEVVDSGVIRRTVKNLVTSAIETDDTFYRWLFTDNPLGFMPEALRFRKVPAQVEPRVPYLSAIGRPGLGTMEIITIGQWYVQTVQTLGPTVNVEYYLRSQ